MEAFGYKSDDDIGCFADPC